MSYCIVSPGDEIRKTFNSINESKIDKNIEIINRLINSGKQNGSDCIRIRIDKSLKGKIGIHRNDINIGIIGEYSDYIEIEVAYK